MRIFLIPIVAFFISNNLMLAQFSGTKSVYFSGNEFDCFELAINQANLSRLTIEKNNDKSSFADLIKKHPDDMLFTSTYFRDDCSPLGLILRNQITENPLNTDPSGDGGNFFLQPNGALLFEAGKALIRETSLVGNLNQVSNAMQSGPILIRGSMVNSNLNPVSTNFKNRSGIGIYSDSKGLQHLVFVHSRSKITFYQLAQFMKQRFNCSEALNFTSVQCALALPFQQEAEPGQNEIRPCYYLRFKAIP
jgi:uncharacterized protein YigE (DUF2233 family)